MWKTVNSPIVIAFIVIIAVFALRATHPPKVATEIRAAYEELNRILQDSASDAEKSKAVKHFAEEISSQIREGFSSGFYADESAKSDADKIFSTIRADVSVTDINIVPSSWEHRQRVIYQIKNDSEYALTSLRVNYCFYRDGTLIDTETKWESDIKLLEPNERIAMSFNRSLPEAEDDRFEADEVKIRLISFDFKKLDPPHIN